MSTENVENDNKKEAAISESPPIHDHVTEFDTFGFGQLPFVRLCMKACMKGQIKCSTPGIIIKILTLGICMDSRIGM